MTTSAIRYGDAVIFIKDAELREFVKAVAINMPTSADMRWLIEACNGWVDDHESLPPGLRHIELDSALTDSGKKSSFSAYLQVLMVAESDEATYDLKAVLSVIERIISRLF